MGRGRAAQARNCQVPCEPGCSPALQLIAAAARRAAPSPSPARGLPTGVVAAKDVVARIANGRVDAVDELIQPVARASWQRGARRKFWQTRAKPEQRLDNPSCIS